MSALGQFRLRNMRHPHLLQLQQQTHRSNARRANTAQPEDQDHKGKLVICVRATQ